jgi:hypothetical protein
MSTSETAGLGTEEAGAVSGRLVVVRRTSNAIGARDVVCARIAPRFQHERGNEEMASCLIAKVKGEFDVRTVVFSADSIRRHFYALPHKDGKRSLYEILSAEESVGTEGLRLAWRVKTLESLIAGGKGTLAIAERAFNLLANPEIRAAYDAGRHDEKLLPFPYCAHGDCVVSGELSADGTTFFADAIISFRPTLRRERITILLRKCEFLPGLICFNDPKWTCPLQ